MDKTIQMEIVQEGLEALKKNQGAYNQAKELAKQILGKHPEISKDKDLTVLLIYSIGIIGKDIVTEVVEGYFKPKVKKFEIITEGTSKFNANMDYLFLMLYAKIQTASLAHKVYVLTRTDIRKDVDFPKDLPDEEGNMPKHRTMSVSLWDADQKKIISLFLVDDQVDLHSKLEQGKSYRMQIGNFNAEKNRWYAAKDPQIFPFDDFKLNEEELANYLINNYSAIKKPYEDIIADEKAHPGKRYVLHARYVKMPSYISLLTEEGAIVILSYNKYVSNTLNENGEVVILGTLQKSRPVEGQPQIADYIIFPDVLLNLNVNEGTPEIKSETQTSDDELDKILD